MNKKTLSALLLVTVVGIFTYSCKNEPTPTVRYNEFMACQFGPDMSSDNLTAMISEWQKLITVLANSHDQMKLTLYKEKMHRFKFTALLHKYQSFFH